MKLAATEPEFTPFDAAPTHTYIQVCAKFKTYYGVTDAEKWYVEYRKHIADTCAYDTHRVMPFHSLAEWVENAQILARYAA